MRVISLRLRIAFIRITRNALKMPDGFLGGLPGPLAWKHCFMRLLAKLKSTFLKRVSRSRVHPVSQESLPCMIGSQ